MSVCDKPGLCQWDVVPGRRFRADGVPLCRWFCRRCGAESWEEDIRAVGDMFEEEVRRSCKRGVER